MPIFRLSLLNACIALGLTVLLSLALPMPVAKGASQPQPDAAQPNDAERAPVKPAPVKSDREGRLIVAASMGHSHNDYYRPTPMGTALDAGMFSIEADVILRDGELYIAHNPHEIRADRTLRKLYLEPLKQAFDKQGGADKDHPFGGRVRADGVPIILMVDFKSDGEKSWRLLEKQLADFAPMLRLVRVARDGAAHVTQGPVIVVVSGNRPIDLMAKARSRFCAYDGRYPSDAGSTAPAHLMPMISNSWSTLNRHADAQGDTTVDEVVDAMQSDAAKHGRVARVWATPDNEKMWSRLAGLDVQLINTDDPGALSAFLKIQADDTPPQR